MADERQGEAIKLEEDGGRSADGSVQTGASDVQPGDERRSKLIWMAALALLAVAVHASVFFAGFVFDDNFNIELRGKASWSHVLGFFTTNQSAFYGSNFYRPVLNLWCEASYALFGTHPTAWHSLSLLLHVFCTLLVFRVAMDLVESKEVAVVAAALFAVHPAQVEAVSWIASAGDLLMTALMLLSVVLFARWMRQGGALWWMASFAAAVGCVFTKESAVLMPLVLLATAAALRPAAKPGLPVLRWTLPFFAVPVVFLVVRDSVLHTFSHPATPASNAEMFYTLPAALLFYLHHMLWPPAVVPFYPLAMVKSWQSAQFLAPLVGVLAAVAAMGYLLVRSAGLRRSVACLAWTAAPLAPALYLKVFPPLELVHDRFLYAPLVGFCIAGALVLDSLGKLAASKLRTRIFLPVALGLIALMSLQTSSQMVWWRNNRTLYAHALTVTPNSLKALDGLAAAYIGEGDSTSALPLLQRSLEINPRDANAMYCIARIAWLRGDYDKAQTYLWQAIRIAPRYDMWLHLASVELHRNQLKAAESAARAALAMSPGSIGVHATLGAVLLARGERQQAARQFRQELRSYPQDAVAREGLERATANPSR